MAEPSNPLVLFPANLTKALNLIKGSPEKQVP